MGLGPTQGDEIADHLELCPSPVTAADVSTTLSLSSRAKPREGVALWRRPFSPRTHTSSLALNLHNGGFSQF
jgi:hypothetical protein